MIVIVTGALVVLTTMIVTVTGVIVIVIVTVDRIAHASQRA